MGEEEGKDLKEENGSTGGDGIGGKRVADWGRRRLVLSTSFVSAVL